MDAAFVGNNFSPIPSKISFQIKKRRLVAARYNDDTYKALNSIWLSTESVSQEWRHVFLKRACRDT